MHPTNRADLNKRIEELERERKDSAQIIADMSARQTAIAKELKTLRASLKQADSTGLRVSDHAVMRYAERHYNINFEAIRAEIEAKFKAMPEGTTNIHILGWVVKDNTVVTYHPTK